MNWVQQHYLEVLAIVGVLYGLARMIVVLTPTPNDNAALDKVAKWLKWIGNLFGLDLTKGR